MLEYTVAGGRGAGGPVGRNCLEIAGCGDLDFRPQGGGQLETGGKVLGRQVNVGGNVHPNPRASTASGGSCGLQGSPAWQSQQAWLSLSSLVSKGSTPSLGVLTFLYWNRGSLWTEPHVLQALPIVGLCLVTVGAGSQQSWLLSQYGWASDRGGQVGSLCSDAPWMSGPPPPTDRAEPSRLQSTWFLHVCMSVPSSGAEMLSRVLLPICSPWPSFHPRARWEEMGGIVDHDPANTLSPGKGGTHSGCRR